jgi:HAMP domain-containing protein
MAGAYIGGLAGGSRYLGDLQSTKERLEENLERLLGELENSEGGRAEQSADSVNLEDLKADVENFYLEINAAEFQASKFQAAGQSVDELIVKLNELRDMITGAGAMESTSEKTIPELEDEIRELQGSFNDIIDSAEFGGHELLNGGAVSIATIDKIEGLNPSSEQLKQNSLIKIDRKLKELQNLKQELEGMRTGRLQEEVAALRISLQNAAAVQSSRGDVESAVENAEILNQDIQTASDSAITAQGNLNSSRVLRLLK